jgi:hypothetical protein
MKKLFLATLILATAAVASLAQTKVVTNKDLEKYRVQRLEAEKDLRKKYLEMGYSSPEEAEKAFAERRARNREYFDRLIRENALAQNQIVVEEADDSNSLEIAEIQAQLNYLRAQNQNYFSQPFIYSYGYAPFAYGGFYNKPYKRRLPRAIRSPRSLNPVIPNGSSIAVPARRPNFPRGSFGSPYNYGGRGFNGGIFIRIGN